MARWALGDGSGLSVDDAIAPDADGTITGTGTSWPAGVPFDVPTVDAGPDLDVTLPTNALLDGLALDDGPPASLATTWTQVSGPDSAVIGTPTSMTTTVSFGGSGTGDYVFRLTADDGPNEVFDEVTVAVLDPGPVPNFGIDFDGTNDYVTFGNNAALGLPQFTIETWFRRDGAGVGADTGSGGVTAIPLVTKGLHQSDGSNEDMNYFLGIHATSGVLVADFEEGAAGTTPGQNHPISGTTVIQNGIWYHAAATYDGTTWRLYLNGVLDATPLPVGQPVRADSIQHSGLATAMNASGTIEGFFNGIMDEARIWNGARTEPQIQAAMTGPVTSAPGLVARWGMDEGTDTTIASTAGTPAVGNLVNGPLWVTGTPFVSSANGAPNVPTNVAPLDGATGVSINPNVEVYASDPNGGQLTTTFYGRTAGPVVAEDFTIVVIPDTQHYVDNAGRTATFNQQTQWIVNNEDALNIVFVTQVGDITESFDTQEIEFERADSAMDILDNAGIPNNIAPGNHDFSTPGAVTSNLFDEWFPPSRYNTGNDWYGGWLGEENGQVQRENKNNYELFSAGGIDFLIVHLEIDMPTFSVQWADEIIDRYPDRQVIISTHAFVNTSNARGTSRITTRADGLTAAQVWTQLIAPNCNVFMVVNGHYPGEGRLTSTNSCGQPVHQVLTDYQSRVNGGDGWLRYYTFRPATNDIVAKTYSPKLGTFEIDATSDFTLAYEMGALAGFEEIGSVETTSGTTASVPWPSRAPNTGYEWYAVTSDGIASRTSPTWTFTTAGTPSNNPPVVGTPGPQTSAEGEVVNLPIDADDPESDPMTFSALGLPPGLTIDANTGVISGTVAFDAAAGSPYTTTVTVSDGQAAPVDVVFAWTVTNTNREPTFDQDVLDRADAENAVISLDAGATDLDGDALTYGATNLPVGLSINAATGLITGTIAYTAAGSSPYSVSVTVTDGIGPGPDATDTFTWTVTNTNREPIFDQDLGNRTDPENASINLDAGATDPDGDALTYGATNLPAGLSIDTGTGLITGTIAFTAAPGPYAVSITVQDGGTVDATDTFSWTVTNTNREPTFDQDVGNRTDAENAVISLDAGATDLDGDALTYAATNLPAGLSINTTTGLITGTIAFTAAPGPYAVSVTVRDGSTVDATDTFTWTVTNVNREPTFDQDVGNRTDAENAVISLDAGATDPDGDPLTYAATNLPAGLSINTATGLITGTIAFTAAPGPYAVSVTVRDSATVDATDTFTWTVTNTNREPTFDQDLANRADPEAAVISLDAGATDPDADPLSYAATNLPTGLSIDPGTGLISGMISTSAAAGSPYSVSITVTDSIGPGPDATDTFTWTVTNANQEPTFDQNLGDRTDAENAIISLDAGATDLDGNPLTYAATGLPAGLSIDPATGLISGTIAFTAAASSPFSVSITVTDSIGPGPDASDTFTWTVTNVNQEPTFDQNLGDRADAENAVITLDAGATDLDGDSLTYAATNLPPGLGINTGTGLITGTITFDAAPGPYAVSITVRDDTTVDAIDTFSWTVTNTNREPTFDQNLGDRTDAENAVISLDAGGTDLDGDGLTYAASNLPAGLSIDTGTGLITGTIAFTAAPGPYAVSVTIRDGATVDATDNFTWTVTNVNREPTFDQNLLDRTDAENAVISLDAGATDPDSDPLTYAATNLPAGLSINASTGLISGTIAFTAAPGPHAVSITVRDGSTVDATDTFTWTVTNVNQEPTFDQNLSNRTDPEAAIISLDAGATDLDGDPLTHEATNLPPGLAISAATGLITGTIDANAAAGSPYAVSITVRDGTTVDATDTFTWTVTNVNREPTFDQNLGNRTDAENAVISLDAGATDLDGDPLTYAATNLPTGLSISPTTGLISGTIAFTAAPGPYAVSITVTDNIGPGIDATDTFSWTVTNVNQEPTFDQDLLDRTSLEGTLISLDAGATDLDGDPLTYAATNLPAGLSINPTTGLISGTIAFTAAPGPYAVSITVRDGATVDATDTFSWTVTDVTPPAGITLRSVSYGSNNAVVTSIVATRPAGVVAGDVLLASIDTRGSSVVTAPAGWTLVRMDLNASSLRKSTYVRVATGSEPATYTWTFSGSRLAAAVIHAYSGVDTTTPVDAVGGQVNASGTAVTAPSITTTVANTMLVGFFAKQSSGTWTPPAGHDRARRDQRDGRDADDVGDRRGCTPGRHRSDGDPRRHCLQCRAQHRPPRRPAAGGRRTTARQPGAHLRSEPARPHRSRGHAHQPRRGRHRPRRGPLDLRRHQPARRSRHQPDHGADQRHDQRQRRGELALCREHHRARRRDRGRHRDLHVDRHERQPGADLRSEPRRSDRCRGRRHQPRRRCHRS